MNCASPSLAAVLASLTLAQGAFAEPATSVEATGIKPLLIQAIEQGSAHGVLVGEPAAYLRRKFDAGTPIEIEVRAIDTLPQPGCRRLEVRTRQQGVLEHGRRSDQELVYRLSYCRDGRFPELR